MDKSNLIEWAKDILIALIIAIIILFFFKPIIIKQSSMEDTFIENDYVIVSCQSYRIFSDYKRGDVIVFESELKADNGKDKNLIKRIIGLPGDTIEIKEGNVFLNDVMLEEPYLKAQGMSGELDKITIKDGELFVMGDNRQVSLDSRSIGPIKMDAVMGRVCIRLFPIKKFGTIKRITY